MEVDDPLEYNLSKIIKSIQGFCVNIVDLEVCSTPSTPPKEREKTTMKTMEGVKSLEEECAKLYEEKTQVWTQLTEYAELQGIE
jgi:hypothetical protein